MAFQSIWYFTNLPKDVVDVIERDLSDNFDQHTEESRLSGNTLNKNIRNSRNAWIPTHHWIGGFIWHYIERANRENFLYDLDCVDGESMQYTHYEVGQFYNWHNDAGIPTMYKPRSIGNRDTQALVDDHISSKIEKVRKLSFVMQLSDPEDYEGGNLQLMDEEGNAYFAPRQRGTVIVFDSRSNHRVLKITKGLRKSIVAWAVGPRWK